MSGFKKITKSIKSVFNPGKVLKNSMGLIDDLTGASAAKKQASALDKQTRAQQQQYEQQLILQRNQNQLQGYDDRSNVATVTAGGTADSVGSNTLSSSSRKNRRNLISSTLGL